MENINWNNKQQVLAAVNKNGTALYYASHKLRNDRDVVMTAVNQNGLALFYASENLKNDKDVVLAAVNQNGYALKYASDILQNDLELLNLLYKFYKLPENKIENEITDKESKKWFEERMKRREILIEQDLMQQSIPENKIVVKSRNFKF